jgi:two-component sensor histidine kinase
LAIIGTALAIYTANSFETIMHHGDFLWMILIITISFFGIGKRFGMIILAIHLLNIGFYTIYSVNHNIAGLLELDFAGRIGLMVEMIAATISITYVIIQFLNFHNYSYANVSRSNDELSEQNSIIQQQHNEKTILIKEVHHRVKNNLQIIISLLRLQKNELKSEESKSQFNEAISRVMAMSLIHQKLYQDETLADIKLETYLTDLKNEILKLSNLTIPLEVFVNTDIERIGLKTIVPLGLIVNELMSNSIEHAFKGSNKGVITVNMVQKDQSTFELTYVDNGSWTDKNTAEISFGLELVQALTDQLEGTVNREISPESTKYSFILKNLDIEK